MNTFLKIQKLDYRHYEGQKTKDLPLLKRIMQRGLNEQYAALSGVVEEQRKYRLCPEVKKRITREYLNNHIVSHRIQFSIIYKPTH